MKMWSNLRYIYKLIKYSVRDTIIGYILCFKLMLRVKTGLLKSVFIKHQFWKPLLHALRGSKLSKLDENAALALRYSRPTAQTALYFTNLRFVDFLGWLLLVLFVLIFWYFGLKAVLLINWFYWLAYSNQLILCFLKYDIYWFLIYIYQYVYNFVVGTCFSVIRTFFMGFNLDLFYMLLHENKITIEEFHTLPQAIQKAFLEDASKDSTIPWLRKLEEKYVKSNEKFKEVYYPWKKKLKSNFNWISMRSAFDWVNKHIFEFIRKLPKINKQNIFNLIWFNKNIQKDIYNEFEFLYKNRASKMDMKRSKILDLKQAELYKMQVSNLRFYKKNQILNEFKDDFCLPYQKQLDEKLKYKQKTAPIDSGFQSKLKKSAFALDWSLVSFWDKFRTVTSSLNLQAKSQYMTTPVTFYSAADSVFYSYWKKKFKRDKPIIEDLAQEFTRFNPLSSFSFEFNNNNPVKQKKSKEELAYKARLIAYVKKLTKSDIYATKSFSNIDNIYKQKINSFYELQPREYKFPMDELHLLYTLNPILKARSKYRKKYLNIFEMNVDLKTKRNIIKHVNYKEAYEQLKNCEVDNVILDIIKHLMLLSARFFIFTKYMWCNLKEFTSLVNLQYLYCQYKYYELINKYDLVETTLNFKDKIKKKEILNAFNVRIIGFWLNLLDTPLVAFSFWFSLLSWLFIYIVNSINKIFMFMPNFADLLKLLWTNQHSNAGYDITIFQMCNVYKELFFFKLFGSNIFFEIIYNYLSYIYISIIQFFKFDVFNNIVFYWEQKYMNFSSAVANFHTTYFPSDHEDTFADYFIDSTDTLLRGNVELLEKSFYELLNVTTQTSKQKSAFDIENVKLENTMLWEDWLKVAVTNFRESIGLISYSRFWYFLPGLSTEFYPQLLDIKLHNIAVKPTNTSVYVFSLWHDSLAKFYNMYKLQDFYTDFKNILEFFWFQLLFCLFSIHYFNILFKQRQFPNPTHPYYYSHYMVQYANIYKKVQNWKYIYGFINEGVRNVTDINGMLAELEYYFREYTLTAFPGGLFLEKQAEDNNMYIFNDNLDLVAFAERIDSILSSRFEILYEKTGEAIEVEFGSVLDGDENVDAQLFDYTPLWSDMLVGAKTDLEFDVMKRKKAQQLSFDINRLSRFIAVVEVLDVLKNKINYFLTNTPGLSIFVKYLVFINSQIKFKFKRVNKYIYLKQIFVSFFPNKILNVYQHYLKYIYNKKIYIHDLKSFEVLLVKKLTMLFAYYSMLPNSVLDTKTNIFLIKRDQFDSVNWSNVLLRLKTIMFYRVFDLKDQTFTIYNVIDKHLKFARISKTHEIMRMWKLMDKKEKALEREFNSKNLQALSSWDEDVFYTKNSYLYLLVSIFLSLFFWKLISLSYIFEFFIFLMVKPYVYFLDYKDLLNLFISKLNNPDGFLTVMFSYFNVDFFINYGVQAVNLKVNPNDIFFFDNNFKLNRKERNVNFSGLQRKLLYMYLKAYEFYLYLWPKRFSEKNQDLIKLTREMPSFWQNRRVKPYKTKILIPSENPMARYKFLNIDKSVYYRKAVKIARLYKRKYAEPEFSLKLKLLKENLEVLDNKKKTYYTYKNLKRKVRDKEYIYKDKALHFKKLPSTGSLNLEVDVIKPALDEDFLKKNFRVIYLKTPEMLRDYLGILYLPMSLILKLAELIAQIWNRIWKSVISIFKFDFDFIFTKSEPEYYNKAPLNVDSEGKRLKELLYIPDLTQQFMYKMDFNIFDEEAEIDENQLPWAKKKNISEIYRHFISSLVHWVLQLVKMDLKRDERKKQIEEWEKRENFTSEERFMIAQKLREWHKEELAWKVINANRVKILDKFMFGSIYHQVFKEVEGQFWIRKAIKKEYWKQLNTDESSGYQLGIKQNRKKLDRAKRKYHTNKDTNLFMEKVYDLIKKGYLFYLNRLTPAELAKLEDPNAKTYNPFKRSQIIHNIRTKLANQPLSSFLMLQTWKDIFRRKQKKYVPLRGWFRHIYWTLLTTDLYKDNFNKTDIRSEINMSDNEKANYELEFLQSVLEQLYNEKETDFGNEDETEFKYMDTEHKTKFDQIYEGIPNYIKAYIKKHLQSMDVDSSRRFFVIKALKYLFEDEETIEYDEVVDEEREALFDEEPTLWEQIKEFMDQQINNIMGHKTMEQLIDKQPPSQEKPERVNKKVVLKEKKRKPFDITFSQVHQDKDKHEHREQESMFYFNKKLNRYSKSERAQLFGDYKTRYLLENMLKRRITNYINKTENNAGSAFKRKLKPALAWKRKKDEILASFFDNFFFFEARKEIWIDEMKLHKEERAFADLLHVWEILKRAPNMLKNFVYLTTWYVQHLDFWFSYTSTMLWNFLLIHIFWVILIICEALLLICKLILEIQRNLEIYIIRNLKTN